MLGAMVELGGSCPFPRQGVERQVVPRTGIAGHPTYPGLSLAEVVLNVGGAVGRPSGARHRQSQAPEWSGPVERAPHLIGLGVGDLCFRVARICRVRPKQFQKWMRRSFEAESRKEFQIIGL